jgi:hypothetical protein
MAGSKDFKLAFGVDASELASGLANAQAAVTAAAEGMRDSLSKVQGAFTFLGEAAVALTTVLAGGEAFEAAIKSTVAGALSARDMGQQLGITASQASVLRVALGETGVSQEAVSAAAARITRTLSTNEGAFKGLGVATRDSNGNFRNTLDIMVDVNSKLAEFKSGTDRNVEAQKIYGRSWQEIAAALRLTHGALDEARERAAALGLVIGARGVADAEAYQKSIAGVDDVFEGMRKVIAESLLPSLTAFANWFGSIGPSVIEHTKEAMQILVGVFETFKVIVLDAWEYLKGFFQEAGTGAVTLAATWQHAMVFDFSGAKAAFNEGWSAMQAIAAEHFSAIKKIGEDAQAAINQVGAQQQNEAPIKQNSGNTDTDDAQVKAQMALWQEQLAKQKLAYEQEQLAQGTFQEWSKQQDLEFWESKLATMKAGSQEQVSLATKVADLQLGINKESFDSQIATMKDQEAEASKDAAVRLALAQKEAEEIGRAYNYIGPEYDAAMKHLTEAARAAFEQQTQIEATAVSAQRDIQLAALTEEESVAKERLAAKQISAQQYVQIEQQLETKIYEIKMQGLQEQEALAAGNDDPLKLAELNAQLETLEAQHQARMLQIQQQGQIKTNQLWNATFANFNIGMSENIAKAIQGTQTIGQSFQKMGVAMETSVVQSLAKLTEEFIEHAAIALILNKQQIFSSASVAAAAAAASAAQVPYIGWILAPLAAASVYAAAIAFPSAEGGYDIPSGMNPMTQLHEREMVLPAPIADTIRGMVELGLSGGGSGRGGGDVHLHLQSWDTTDVKRWIGKPTNRNLIAKSLRDAHTGGSAHLHSPVLFGR